LVSRIADGTSAERGPQEGKGGGNIEVHDAVICLVWPKERRGVEAQSLKILEKTGKLLKVQPDGITAIQQLGDERAMLSGGRESK